MTLSKLDIQVQGPTAPGSVDDFELAFARRSLAHLKKRLGRDAMEQLLLPDIEEAEKFWARLAVESKGELKAAVTKVATHGRLSMAQFLDWFHLRLDQDETAMLAAHPEHYGLYPTEDKKGAYVVETLNDYITSLVIPELSLDGDKDPDRDFSYPVAMVGKFYTKAGTPVGKVLHQFRDYEDGSGFEVSLGIYFPAAGGERVLEPHRQHLAVEFRNWITAAYEELNG